MEIGKLDKRVVLQKPTVARDTMGGGETTWADYSTVWAAITPVSAAETVKSGRQVGELTHKIRIRYNANVLTDWKLKFGDRYFAVIGPPINPAEKNEWLDLLCKEAY